MMADKSTELAQQNIDEVDDLQRKLQESEERYHSLVTALAQMVWVINSDGVMEQQMDAWYAYTGQLGTRLNYQDMLAVVHPQDRQWVERTWQNSVARGKSYEMTYRLRRYDGAYRRFSVRAIPVFGEHNKIREWIYIGTDVDALMHNEHSNGNGTSLPTKNVLVEQKVTDTRRMERRTHKALQGLLSMAENLLRLSDERLDMRKQQHQLIELACNVLDCHRAGYLLVEEGAELLRPSAVVGLTPEQEQNWWQCWSRAERKLNDYLDRIVNEKLHQGEGVLVEDDCFFEDRSCSTQVLLVVPVRVGERLIGILVLDHEQEAHRYTPNEVTLAEAVARFSALIIERQSLLHAREEAQVRVVALRETNQRMEEFIGIASHELRTPLTAIKVNVQLAMRRLKAALKLAETMKPEVAEKVMLADDLMGRAERQIGVLSQLVSDMVDISRIQAGRIETYLRKEPCDLREAVERAINEQQKTHAGRTIHREFLANESMPVIADAGRISQVVSSYLSNALKYSAADRGIDVSLTLQGEWVRLAVRDRGQGLTEEEQKRAWECFYQCPRIRVLSGSGVGLGLGLYISKTIIELHQGRIGVESVPGQGSTFWFELPMARVEGC